MKKKKSKVVKSSKKSFNETTESVSSSKIIDEQIPSGNLSKSKQEVIKEASIMEETKGDMINDQKQELARKLTEDMQKKKEDTQSVFVKTLGLSLFEWEGQGSRWRIFKSTSQTLDWLFRFKWFLQKSSWGRSRKIKYSNIQPKGWDNWGQTSRKMYGRLFGRSKDYWKTGNNRKESEQDCK
jgi:hypothetical protein